MKESHLSVMHSILVYNENTHQLPIIRNLKQKEKYNHIDMYFYFAESVL